MPSASPFLAGLVPAAGQFFAAAKLIEGWLFDSAVQVSSGPYAGGIPGWLDGAGAPGFLYGEITGYWLTWISGLNRDRAARVARAAAAVAFLEAMWSRDLPPHTRLYLDGAPLDWRNRAVFSFDMTMILRGLAHAATLVGTERCAAAAKRVVPWLLRCLAPDGTFSTHTLVTANEPLPRRWSTEPGPFLAKAAAALLQVPAVWLPPELAAAGHRTLAKWQGRANEHVEMHPRLYALEGNVLGGAAADRGLGGTRVPPDGRLRENSIMPCAPVRADVLAQGIRILLLAEDDEVLVPAGPVMALAGSLLEHVTPEGAVLFRAGSGLRNVWCALFATQALSWLAARLEGQTIERCKLI